MAEDCVTRTDAVEMRVKTWKEEIAALLDQVDDSLDRIESKRKRIQGAEAKAEKRLHLEAAAAGAEAADPSTMTREQAIAYGRHVVYGERH